MALIILVLLSALFSSYTLGNDKPEEVGMSTVVEEIQNGIVESLIIEGAEVQISLKDGARQITRKESSSSISEMLVDYGITPEQLKAANISVSDRTTRS